MGGYVLVDCKGLDLLKSQKQTIDGIHERVAAAMATGKPVYAENCVWGPDNYVSPINVICTTDSGDLTATASTLQIRIGTDDGCTVNNFIS